MSINVEGWTLSPHQNVLICIVSFLLSLFPDNLEVDYKIAFGSERVLKKFESRKDLRTIAIPTGSKTHSRREINPPCTTTTMGTTTRKSKRERRAIANRVTKSLDS